MAIQKLPLPAACGWSQALLTPGLRALAPLPRGLGFSAEVGSSSAVRTVRPPQSSWSSVSLGICSHCLIFRFLA